MLQVKILEEALVNAEAEKAKAAAQLELATRSLHELASSREE